MQIIYIFSLFYFTSNICIGSVRAEENSLLDLWRWPVLDLSSPSARSRYLHSRVYRHLYRARLFALAGHERIVGRVLNRALVFGVNKAREGENEIERMSEKKRVRGRCRSEREGKRKADSTARTNRENVHVYWSLNHLCLRSTCSHPTPFSSASLPVPCNPAESHSLSPSLSLCPPSRFHLDPSLSVFARASLW